MEDFGSGVVELGALETAAVHANLIAMDRFMR